MRRTELSKLYAAEIDHTLVVSPDANRCSRFGLRFSRESWPLGFRLLTVIVEWTPDSGRSWLPVGTTTFHGGTIRPFCSVTYVWSAHDGQPKGRYGDLRLRFRATQDLTTAISLVTVDDPPGKPSPIHHSVAVDGETNTSAAIESVSSQSVSRTSAGSNRCGIGHYGTIDDAISAVTWNAAAANDSLDHLVGSNIRAGVHVFVNPPTGSSTVLFDWGAGQAVGAVGASGYNGVDQATPVRASSKTTDGALAGEVMVCACTSQSGDMGVGSASVFGGTLTSPLGTEVFNTSAGEGENWGAGQYRAASGSSVSLGWTADDDCAMAALVLAASAEGGGAAHVAGGSGFQRSHRPAPFMPGFGR
jgi:hypothetical protein